MKKKDLRNGMVIEYRNGKRRLFLENMLFDIYDTNNDTTRFTITNNIDNYYDNLKYLGDNTLDICKIYKDYRVLIEKDIKQDFLLLWERGEEIDWNKVVINTPILVRNHDSHDWEVKHFAGLSESGEVMAWYDGKTSYTVEDIIGNKTPWCQAKLYNNKED